MNLPKIISKHTHYIFYASSILFGRGLEYLWFFIISYYATKEQYGTFELYKKIIEFFSVVASLGFPALIITYTKSKKDKNNFFITGVFLSVVITFCAAMVFFLFGKNYLFLVVPILFFAIFHYSNSIFQAYNLVDKGSNYASVYKSVVSVLFTGSILIAFYFVDRKELSLVYCTYPLFLIGIAYLVKNIKKVKIHQAAKSIIRTLKNQAYNGTVLFITTLVNTSFLATDVFIISYYSGATDTRLADYSFPLMIANALLIIPTTLTNVDVENYKKEHDYFRQSLKKNTVLTIVVSLVLFGFYLGLINTFYTEYQNTLFIFTIILTAKIVQSITVPYGVYLGTKGIYTYQLKVLLISLFFNIGISLLIYKEFELIGIAIVSFFGLLIRYLFYLKKYNNGRHLWSISEEQ